MKQLKTIIITTMSILGVFLTACGSDSSSGVDTTETSEVKTIHGLGECKSANEGVTKFVTSEDQYYKCVNGDWEEAEVPVQSSSSNNSLFAGSSSSNKVLPGVDTESSSSSEFFNTDSISGYDPINRTLTDTRDGQTYRTVKIGDQVWMAENLNYNTTDSYCYEDQASNCGQYGRLYTWNAAQGVCPTGWHLPSKEEFDVLVVTVGGEYVAGKRLKSRSWFDDSGALDGNIIFDDGNNAFGFSALPAGVRGKNDADYEGVDKYTLFWSSTEYGSDSAYVMLLEFGDEYAWLFRNYKYEWFFSVRCLKDDSSSSISQDIKDGSTYDAITSTLTDLRDGQTYRTIVIATDDGYSHVWMAENLNYRYLGPTAGLDSSSFCYDNDPVNCDTYGRLYLWSAAMDSAGIIQGNAANGCGHGLKCSPGTPFVRGVCPKGWHLPDYTEWSELFRKVGGENSACRVLKSRTGWLDDDGKDGNGDDAFEFSALPAGIMEMAGGRVSFNVVGYSAEFWCSDEDSNGKAYHVNLYYNRDYAYEGYSYKGYGYSVRCLKD